MLKPLFQNALSVLAEKGVVILMTFITTPILLRELGLTTYGVWILLINMVAWARIFDLGFSSAVTRTAAIYVENNNQSEMNALFNSSLLLNLIFSSVGVLIVCMPMVFPEILQLPENYLSEARIILICIAVKVLADFLLMSLNSLFSAVLKTNILANISTLSEVTKGVATIYLVLSGYGILGMLFALMITDLLALIVKVYFLKTTFPNLGFGIRFISRQHIVSIFSFSKYILLANVAMIIRKRVGVNVVSKFVGVAAVAPFNIAQQLVLHCENVITIISQVASPAVSRVLNRQDKSQETRYISMISRLNLFSTVIILIPLIVCVEPFIRIWLGEEFGKIVVMVQLFSLTLISKFVYYSANSVMIARAKHQKLPVIHITGAVLTLLLSIGLAKIFGVLGVVAGLILAELVTEIIFFTPVLLRELAEQRVYFLRLLAGVFIIAVGLFSLEVYLVSEIMITSWLGLFAFSMLVFFINTVIFWSIIFNKTERSAHLQLLRRG